MSVEYEFRTEFGTCCLFVLRCRHDAIMREEYAKNAYSF